MTGLVRLDYTFSPNDFVPFGWLWVCVTCCKEIVGVMLLGIPKPGKDLTKPTSYRPISLLPAMGKIFERIVASRLSAFLEKVDYFDDSGKSVAL